jgi:peroxidase
MQGGPYWRVPTGRRDGRVSLKQEALDQIPAPTMNFTDLLASFRSKGLELPDLVWLSGNYSELDLPRDYQWRQCSFI